MLLVLLAGCSDLREFQGTWRGARVGESPALRVGVATSATAELSIEGIDAHGLRGHLAIDGLVDDAELVSLAGAEADTLSGLTFSGSPLRVYLAFVKVADSQGEALAVVALYNDRRIEVRLLRGGQVPVYAIFVLTGP